MAEDGQVRWHPPLKVPAVEIISLLSDDDEIGKALDADHTNEVLNASEGSQSDSDSQWSLYEDALQAEDDEGQIHGGKQLKTLLE
jgi:hypothetical protein